MTMRPTAIVLAVAALMSAFPAMAGRVASAASPDPVGPVAPTVAPGDPSVSGPTVALERDQVRAGDAIQVELAGFEAALVSVTICGNEGRRGSQDCNMRASRTREISDDAPTTLLRYDITAPPEPCPCVIRATSSDQSEMAVAPVFVVGHPIAAPVDPVEPGELVEVRISATPRHDGLFDRFRSSLGGATDYDLSVSVRNTSASPLTGLTASATVGRNATEQLTTVDLDDPGSLAVGQTWVQVAGVELPRSVRGGAEWRVRVSGAGPSVLAVTSTRNRPTALYVLLVILVVDVLVILYRSWRRSKRRKQPDDGDVRRGAPVIEVSAGDEMAADGELAPSAR